MRTYPLNETIVLTSAFRDPNTNKPRDPNSVVCRVRDPVGIETRPTVSKTGVGEYTAKFTPSIAGRWHVRWEGKSQTTSVMEHQFEITPSAFEGAS